MPRQNVLVAIFGRVGLALIEERVASRVNRPGRVAELVASRLLYPVIDPGFVASSTGIL
jgi:hypothetical protein